MLKTIGLLSVLSAGIVATAYLPAGDASSEGACSQGACSQKTASAEGCACPGTETAACSAGESCSAGKNCCSAGEMCCSDTEQCCSESKQCSECSAGCEKECAGCPSEKLTSANSETSCSAEGCAGGNCAACSAVKETGCEGCPSAKLTSADVGAACTAGSCSGEKCSAENCSVKDCATCASAADGSCSGCPSTKLTSGDATAGCSEGKCCGTCEKSEAIATSAGQCTSGACSASCSSDCQDCPITAAMAKLPQMTYVVGKEKVACPKAAESMAQTSGDAVHFAVGDKKFDDESKAKLALVEATEHFVASFSKPKVCSQSGKVTVAGHEACCEGTAAKMAAKAASAMDSVSMTYLVGDKACACPKEAAKLAQDSGDIQLFVVGEDKTACDVTARLSLARAKYRAAIVALMQASSDTTQASSETKETSKES